MSLTQQYNEQPQAFMRRLLAGVHVLRINDGGQLADLIDAGYCLDAPIYHPTGGWSLNSMRELVVNVCKGVEA